MKQILTLAFALICASQTFAQSAVDALRYSYLQPSGTARYVGAGGAFGALGAEFGAISQNPAGLALFRSNELTLTPSIHFNNTAANLPRGLPYNSNESKFNFDNVGLVFNTTPQSGHWKTFNYGMGFNRQANFTQSIYYEGDAPGTIMNGFFADAQSNNLDQFGSQLASDANAIYKDTDGNLSYDFAGNEQASVHRAHGINTYGGVNEMTLSFAGNYDEKLMIGATVGVPFVNYRQEGVYTESDPNNVVPFFDKLVYTEYLHTNGVGVNLKLGLIYKVSQALRLGAAFHTPTAFSFTDNYSNSFTYDYTDGNGPSIGKTQNSPSGNFDYRLHTPWRANASAALVVKKMGFLSADVEWVDYSANAFDFTRHSTNQDDYAYEQEVNRDIVNSYQQAVNLKFGGELVLDKFRLRAGLNLLGKPQAHESGFNTGYSAGAGYRGESFFLDFGWRRREGIGSVSAYAGAPVANTKIVSNDYLMTFGFKF